uniref:Retinol binding protein 1, cellular, tandem duplicate 1 n=1 Tax=Oncorhynchus mykiss TaxID=8022 RepID=A0A8C7NH01_ONCMY
MPVDLNGYWKMISNDNFEEYLKALDVNVAIRKIATLLKPDKDISHDGDHVVIKTLSTFKNYNMDFSVGKEFEEDLSGVDDRKCMTTISWEGDKLLCVQKGEKDGRGWTHWVEGDALHLVRESIHSCHLNASLLPQFLILLVVTTYLRSGDLKHVYRCGYR